MFFDILPQSLTDFEAGLTEEAQAIELLEPKTARFHLWQHTTNRSRWLVLEAFREPAGGDRLELVGLSMVSLSTYVIIYYINSIQVCNLMYDLHSCTCMSYMVHSSFDLILLHVM